MQCAARINRYLYFRSSNIADSVRLSVIQVKMSTDPAASTFIIVTRLRSTYQVFHSTEVDLTGFINDLLAAFDSGKPCVLMMSLGSGAAFDTLDRDRLQAAMDLFGLTGRVQVWLRSYRSYLSIAFCRLHQCYTAGISPRAPAVCHLHHNRRPSNIDLLRVVPPIRSESWVSPSIAPLDSIIT